MALTSHPRPIPPAPRSLACPPASWRAVFARSFLPRSARGALFARSFAREKTSSPFLSTTPALLQFTRRHCGGQNTWGIPQSASPLFNLPACAAVSPLESALTDELRVGFQGLYLQTLTQQTTGFGRTTPPATPLDSALTDTLSVTPLESALTKKPGEGGATCAIEGRLLPGSWERRAANSFATRLGFRRHGKQNPSPPAFPARALVQPSSARGGRSVSLKRWKKRPC